MPAISNRVSFQLSAVLLVAFALVLTSCGGGSGGGSGGSGGPLAVTVVETSFQGFPFVPGGGLPTQARDELLLLRFNAPIDSNIFNGFQTIGASPNPQTFVGFSSTDPVNGISYFAFRDQVAARQAFQVYENVMNGAFYAGGVLGRQADDPNVLVFDPTSDPGNPFGVPFSTGFAGNTLYNVFIPANSGLTAGGNPVSTFGSLPPVNVPAFSPSPAPSVLLMAGPGFAPDSIPPQVVEISTLAIDNGSATAGAIPDNDTIRVTFSEPIDVATLNRQVNLLIRNTSVTTTTEPLGVIVAVEQTADATNSTFFFTPTPSFGAGPFQIQVSVGMNANDSDDILDPPAGAEGTQNALANSLQVTFTTVANPGQPTAVTAGEDFSTNDQEDTSFPTPADLESFYNKAPWNQNGNQLLIGLPIDGSANPLVGDLGDMQVGAPRTQISITPNGVASGVSPNPLLNFSTPFDDDQTNGCANNIITGTGTTNCGTIFNPDGGNHLQHMYVTRATANEIPNNFADTIELFEWGATSFTANPFTFNNFAMLMSATAADGPTLGQTPMQSLVVGYDNNFDFLNPQNLWIMPDAHPSPNPALSPNESPIVVYPNAPYPLGDLGLSGQFIPYPMLVLPFDFNANRMENNQSNTMVKPSFLVDIDIQAPVPPTSNLVVGTNVNSPQPPRRLRGSPGATVAEGQLDSVVYHGRFTSVKKNSSAQTLFYDLGSVSSVITYENLALSPAVSERPAGSFITVEIQGADTVNASMDAPTGTSFTPFLTLVNRDGTTNTDTLDMMANRRFFRLRFSFEANVSNNALPSVNGFLLGYAFGATP